MSDEVLWTISGRRGENASSWSPVERFNTKAEAVRAMESKRKPKTAVHRIFRDYIFFEKEA